MKNKPWDEENKFDKTIGEGSERMSVTEFLIKSDGEIVFVLAFKLDNEVKGLVDVLETQE